MNRNVNRRTHRTPPVARARSPKPEARSPTIFEKPSPCRPHQFRVEDEKHTRSYPHDKTAKLSRVGRDSKYPSSIRFLSISSHSRQLRSQERTVSICPSDQDFCGRNPMTLGAANAGAPIGTSFVPEPPIWPPLLRIDQLPVAPRFSRSPLAP